MITFTLKPHSFRHDVMIVEVHEDSELICTLTPGDNPREIRIISKFLSQPVTEVKFYPREQWGT